jgi:hypothetical protein
VSRGASLEEPDEGSASFYFFSRVKLWIWPKVVATARRPPPFLNLLKRPVRGGPADNRHNALFVLSIFR